MVRTPLPIPQKMTRSLRTLATLLCLGSCVPASAQSLRMPTSVFAGAAAADWATTYDILSKGGHEINPTINWLHDRPIPTVAAGVAIDAAGVWLWQRYVGRRHPKIAAVGLYVAAGFRVALSADNFTHRSPRRR